MNESWYDKGLLTGIASFLQMITPPLVASALIPALILAFDAKLTDSYQMLMVLSFVVTFFIFKDMNRSAEPRDTDYLSHVGRSFGHWLLVIGTLAILGYALKISAEYSRRILLTWTVVTPFMIGAAQFLIERMVVARLSASGVRRSAIIAGVNDYSRRLGQALRKHPRHGIRLLGYFDDRSQERLGLRDPSNLIGRLEELPSYVRQQGVEVIYIALPITHEDRTRQIIEELQDTTASIYFVPDIFVFDLIQSSVNMIDGVPILGLCESPYLGINKLIKKLSDIIISSLLLLAAAPVLLVIALSIKIFMPGSVIFRQRRYGMDGEEITVYKFRTMTTSDDSTEVIQATENDTRVTPLGRLLRRYSLDELPQLVNVLQGRMSIVGPRPHAVAHNEMYRKLIKGYMIRHKVAPGITGLAQVNGLRGETKTVGQMESRVAYDLEYLRSWSLGLDLKIILKTVLMIFRDSKAF
jgi:putative colanic acid biosynthesis UDP-glucose lipid carrier transferase